MDMTKDEGDETESSTKMEPDADELDVEAARTNKQDDANLPPHRPTSQQEYDSKNNGESEDMGETKRNILSLLDRQESLSSWDESSTHQEAKEADSMFETKREILLLTQQSSSSIFLPGHSTWEPMPPVGDITEPSTLSPNLSHDQNDNPIAPSTLQNITADNTPGAYEVNGPDFDRLHLERVVSVTQPHQPVILDEEVPSHDDEAGTNHQPFYYDPINARVVKPPTKALVVKPIVTFKMCCRCRVGGCKTRQEKLSCLGGTLAACFSYCTIGMQFVVASALLMLLIKFVMSFWL